MKYTGLLAVSFAIALGCCGCDENAKSPDGQNNAFGLLKRRFFCI